MTSGNKGGDKDLSIMKTRWDHWSCLDRAQAHLRAWEKDSTSALPLIYCALEMRFAIESFLLVRYEDITGCKPKPKKKYLNPEAIITELLAVDDEAMNEQSLLIGFTGNRDQMPSTYSQWDYTVLAKEKARSYLGKLGDILHATVKVQPHSYLKYFWDERYQILSEIHTELSRAITGTLTRPVRIIPRR